MADDTRDEDRRKRVGPTPRSGGAATPRDAGGPRQSPADKAIRPGQGGMKTK